MSDISFENSELCFFCTTRTMNSRLWFINNPKLTERILASLAKYQEVYGVIIYAFVLMGNHYHLIACFPNCNKAAFFRDFNSMIAKLVAHYVKGFEGGKLWGRRVRCQVVPRPTDIRERFFYAALNPVSAGICPKISEYQNYNSFSDAVQERERGFEVVNWEKFNERKRFNKKLTAEEFTRTYTLRYSRLPEFESMSKAEMLDKLQVELEQRQHAIVQLRTKEGKGFATIRFQRTQRVGSRPKFTKRSTRFSKRPLVLTLCAETRKRFLDWYFALRSSFKEASLKLRSGFMDVSFPPGTYRPTYLL